MPLKFTRPSRSLLARGFLAFPLAIWMGFALGFRLPGPPLLTASLGVLVPTLAFIACLRLPTRQGLAWFATAFLGVLAGFLLIRPSNQRPWQPDVAKLATGRIEGHSLVIQNVRHCRYQAEDNYEVSFAERVYDLNQLQAIDLFLVSWGPRHIAHTILSFDFGQGNHLAFSIETRKEQHESYSALRGFFREYELCIIAGDERDLIQLRTNYRKENVRLYRLNTPPGLARAILLDYVERINQLAQHPEWYNALTDNCTTAMLGPLRKHSHRLPWSWKLIASGHLDELLYDRGIITHRLPFDTLRQAVLVNDRAMSNPNEADYSSWIRANLPPR